MSVYPLPRNCNVILHPIVTGCLKCIQPQQLTLPCSLCFDVGCWIQGPPPRNGSYSSCIIIRRYKISMPSSTWNDKHHGGGGRMSKWYEQSYYTLPTLSIVWQGVTMWNTRRTLRHAQYLRTQHRILKKKPACILYKVACWLLHILPSSPKRGLSKHYTWLVPVPCATTKDHNGRICLSHLDLFPTVSPVSAWLAAHLPFEKYRQLSDSHVLHILSSCSLEPRDVILLMCRPSRPERQTSRDCCISWLSKYTST